jgi:type II secretory pathway component PulC
VTIFGDYQSASVVNPGRPLRKGERETLTVKVGERIGGYKLAKIMPDRIAMESSGDTFEVLLYDSKKPKKRMEARAETKPEMIASAQPAPVSPSGEVPMPAPAQESVKEPKAPVQTQVTASIPFNKYTYQLLGPSAVIGRGRILYTPTPGPSAQ